MVKTMGAGHIIDYTNEDVLQEKNTYDIFFDAVGNQSFFQVKETLKPHGIYVTTLPSFQSMILGPLINVLGPKKFKKLLVSPRSKDLTLLKEMAENGKLVPVLEEVFSMDQIQEAHTRSETGRVVGKVVIKVV
jgi:NADPH:quinone reductase-like Zn-dependent oxidoreductase